MNKIKDIFWLLFWGALAGAVFVGCILGFGAMVNWLNANSPSLVSPGYFKVGLGVVMCVVLFGIFKIGAYFNHKITRRQAEQIFPPDFIPFIYKAPLAKAVVEHRHDRLDDLRFLPEEARCQAVNAPVHNGVTPLHIAAALGRKEFCAKLIKYGADVQARDNAGQTPLDYAVRFGQPETEALLRKAQDNSR